MPPPPRIVWLLDRLGLGGAERLALRFAAAPLPWRIEVVALTPEPRLAALWGEALAPLEGRIHLLDLRGLDDARTGWRLLRLLARWRPVLIHSHLRYATVCGGALGSVLGRPHVATIHLGPGARPEATRRQRVIAACEGFSRRRAARVIYVSAAQRRAWNAQAAHERAVVIGNGVAAAAPVVAVERARLRRQLGLPEQATVLATVAMVRAAKGWRTWVRAVERIAAQRPQARFVWVGGGEEEPALRQAVAQSPAAEQIVLPGVRRDVPDWLAASDLFLFPSYEEAQPTAVMEAMAAGLPIIASRLPAIVEVLDGCGCLVDAGDAAALAEAALAWSAPGCTAARAAGAGARRRAQGPLSEGQWQQRLSALYEEVLRD